MLRGGHYRIAPGARITAVRDNYANNDFPSRRGRFSVFVAPHPCRRRVKVNCISSEVQ